MIYDYYEAQIHGTLTLKDVKYIYYDSANAKKDLENLKKKIVMNNIEIGPTPRYRKILERQIVREEPDLPARGPTPEAFITKKSKLVKEEQETTIVKVVQSTEREGHVSEYSKKYSDAYMYGYKKKAFDSQEATIVSGEIFDKNLSNILFRGIEDKKFLESNLNGEWTGSGSSGNGLYFAGGDNPNLGLQIVSGYTRFVDNFDSWIYAVKLKPDAKIILFKDIKEQHIKHMKDLAIRDYEDPLVLFDQDVGRYALRLGYDAIVSSEERTFVIILNNSALIVDERSLIGGSRAIDKIQVKEKLSNATNYDVAKPFGEQYGIE